MVGVAQLVEHQVVALVAEGSSPFAHPILKRDLFKQNLILKQDQMRGIMCMAFMIRLCRIRI